MNVLDKDRRRLTIQCRAYRYLATTRLRSSRQQFKAQTRNFSCIHVFYYTCEIKHAKRNGWKQTIKNAGELQYHATKYYPAWQCFGILSGKCNKYLQKIRQLKIKPDV